MSKLLQMQGIQKSFYGVEVLHKVDLEIEKGQIMALCGENGGGKSTLMKILAGIYEQNAGDVIFKGNYIDKTAGPMKMQKLGISMIHQELILLNELTIAQNFFMCREPHSRLGLIDHAKMNRDAAVLL
jgi:ribose transport system ATP-binding protein